eukprot:g2260.t1
MEPATEPPPVAVPKPRVGRALWRSSPSTFHRARDHTACDPTWCCAARAPMRSVQVEVIGLLPAMSQQGIGPNAFTLSSTVAACGRRQQWLKALLLHAAARREAAEAAVPTPSELVGAGVGALARAECWQDAGHLLQSLQLARGAIASVVASNAALGGAGGVVGGWSWALGLFAGLALPDLLSFNSALKACEVGSCWDGALALLFRLHSTWRLQPDFLSEGSAVEACGLLSRWPWSLQLLQRPTTASFQAVIDALDRGTKRTRSECDARRGVQTDGKGGYNPRAPQKNAHHVPPSCGNARSLGKETCTE